MGGIGPSLAQRLPDESSRSRPDASVPHGRAFHESPYSGMTPQTPEPPRENASKTSTSPTEMQGSFLEYAYSVIYSRALPDARDGLKPVQRRILYQMSDMGLRPDRGHVKSARVVGEVMGKLHPHGDTAIYDALVRMAQSFTLRVPLIDGHGNFGSLDDGPAAPRYTEARLAAAALAMTDDLDEDVVDFVPNYDNQLTQPEVLPAAFPNLLVNGASGIAVGMATNMAPHNLVEVVGGGAPPDRQPRRIPRRPDVVRPGPRPARRRHDRRPRRHPRRLRDRPRRFKTRAKVARREPHGPQGGPRRDRAALPRGPREGDREDQRRRQHQEAAAASPTSPT